MTLKFRSVFVPVLIVKGKRLVQMISRRMPKWGRFNKIQPPTMAPKAANTYKGWGQEVNVKARAITIKEGATIRSSRSLFWLFICGK
jgi:hypothetical protein